MEAVVVGDLISRIAVSVTWRFATSLVITLTHFIRVRLSYSVKEKCAMQSSSQAQPAPENLHSALHL